MQKILLEVLIASQKLSHYFQVHPIAMVTSYPLKRIVHNHEITGHIAEWDLKFSGFDIKFLNSHAVKSKALAEFVVEWTPTPSDEEEPASLPMKEDLEHRVMYFAGSFSLGGTGAGVLLVSLTGEHLKYVIQMLYTREKATTNTDEYEGLLAGLRIAVGLRMKRHVVKGNS